MNKYKIISMAAAVVIVIAGCVYLAFGSATLATVLLVCAASLCVMGGANAAELKSSGIKGLPAYIPVICFAILAALVAGAGIYSLIK